MSNPRTDPILPPPAANTAQAPDPSDYRTGHPPDSLPLGSPERRAWWLDYLAHVQAHRAAARRAEGQLCIVLGAALLVSAALLWWVWP